MKIVLTGAGGFIGSCFLRKLNDMGVDDAVIVDTAPAPDGYANLQSKKFSDYLTREALLERVEANRMGDPDVVVHLGACADTTEMDRAFLAKNNVDYSRALCRWALARGKHFHYASSASVYGDGKVGYDDAPEKTAAYKALNPYGESKLMFDQWLITQKLTDKVVGYRYFNVYGPNEYHKGDMRSMVCKAYDQLKADGKVKLFASSRPGYSDGSEERDFIYVKDVNDVMAYFVEHPDRNGIFNVGTGKARSFLDLMLAVFAALEKTPQIEFIPMPDKLRGQYQYFTQADLTRLRSAGYTRPFTSLEDAVRDYVCAHLAQNKRVL